MNLIEAALYVAGRPLDLNMLSSISKVKSERNLQNLLSILMKKYNDLDGPIQILKLQDERYVMQLKPEYCKYVKKLSNRPLLKKAPLKTLSFIAFRQPITQAYIAQIRGSNTYKHIKILREMGLIEEKKSGRTKILRTTSNFSDYFNLSRDIKTMKKQLEKIFEQIS
ncbi:MAG: SMC-Scp complex subunit ScpB [Candidatus Bathyarchaeota archaeon]|nr:SMC-Scp complex subunit ScpB [Candidatus Bathyarchaeota archaeon]